MQWSSWSIVPAVNALRSNALKFAQRPENGALLQNKRLCVLPIRWRALLEEATDIFAKRKTGKGEADDDDDGWSLDDAMPHSLSSFRAIVRDVVLDVPLYLSHHRELVIRVLGASMLLGAG